MVGRDVAGSPLREDRDEVGVTSRGRFCVEPLCGGAFVIGMEAAVLVVQTRTVRRKPRHETERPSLDGLGREHGHHAIDSFVAARPRQRLDVGVAVVRLDRSVPGDGFVERDEARVYREPRRHERTDGVIDRRDDAVDDRVVHAAREARARGRVEEIRREPGRARVRMRRREHHIVLRQAERHALDALHHVVPHRFGHDPEVTADVRDASSRCAILDDDRAREERREHALTYGLGVTPPEEARPRLVHGDRSAAEARAVRKGRVVHGQAP